MSQARGFGIFIAVCVAVYMAYSIATTLHIVYFPSWPEWVCWIVGGGVTLALMTFIVTGAGNVFFEGLVVWTICGSLLAFAASMPVSARENHLKAMQRWHLRQQHMQQEQERLEQQRKIDQWQDKHPLQPASP